MQYFLKKLPLLLLIAVGGMLMLEICYSHVPKVMQCPQNNNDIVIFNSSFWLECENGQLVQKYCVIQGNIITFTCIPTNEVVKEMLSFGGKGWPGKSSLFTDNTFSNPHCLVLNKELAHHMATFSTKQDCLQGYEVKNLMPDLTPCKIKNRNVYFLDEEDWSKCADDGDLLLQKCVFKFPDDDQYWCMDVQRIIDLFWETRFQLEIEKRVREDVNLCKDLVNEMHHVNSNFRKELKICNSDFPSYGQAAIPIQSQIPKLEVEPEKTEPKVDEERIVKAEETDTESEEETDLIDTKPYPGGRFGKILIKRCKEEPVAADDDCFYKCGRPYMCKTNDGQCLSFRAVEQMFNDSHSGNNKYRRYTNGPWSSKKYQKILKNLAIKNKTIFMRPWNNINREPILACFKDCPRCTY